MLRRQLGRRLKRLRERAGRTEQEVDDAKLMSRTKLWRIESGKTRITVPDSRALCWFYGADEETTQALASLAVGTGKQGWWEEYGDAVPTWFRLYVSLEAAAARMQSYDSELVPALLQTEDYADAILRTGPYQDNEDIIRRQVAVRMERQDALSKRVPPPGLVCLLSEAVLDREVGGSDVMARQVDRLRQAVTVDRVEVRIVPWDAGAHASMVGGFTIMDFEDEEDPDVVYLESYLSGWYLEKEHELAAYRHVFESVYAQSVPIEEYHS